MILSTFDPEARRGTIVLRPNRSWTWQANMVLVGTLLAVSGTVATVFAYRGMWVILPFTLVEMSILLACLYYCVRRTHRAEVLTFSPHHLVLERGVRAPQSVQRYDRFFARFLVRKPAHPWYRTRVALRCRDQETEIGAFLTGTERTDLVHALRDMIQRFDRPESWARQ